METLENEVFSGIPFHSLSCLFSSCTPAIYMAKGLYVMSIETSHSLMQLAIDIMLMVSDLLLLENKKKNFLYIYSE